MPKVSMTLILASLLIASAALGASIHRDRTLDPSELSEYPRVLKISCSPAKSDTLSAEVVPVGARITGELRVGKPDESPYVPVKGTLSVIIRSRGSMAPSFEAKDIEVTGGFNGNSRTLTLSQEDSSEARQRLGSINLDLNPGERSTVDALTPSGNPMFTGLAVCRQI